MCRASDVASVSFERQLLKNAMFKLPVHYCADAHGAKKWPECLRGRPREHCSVFIGEQMLHAAQNRLNCYRDFFEYCTTTQ